MKIVTASDAETESIVFSLKWKISSGYDELTSKILKVCPSLISLPLSHIYNSLPQIKKPIPSADVEVMSKFLRTCASLVSWPLSSIYNHSYTGNFPDHLEFPIVKPLMKKGDKITWQTLGPFHY